ncbi:lipopolysaccharide biosynthesis protein [Colwellia sp. MB02u-9]|uniref:lipopolysaccharide biosynthesis protein n=1 Tax=Colwellia sp. MB02u-9 TaxID=2759823 RepID=UPI0015F78475|nr:oligosaccharide flippase family protein [Colwellia sp. MB02u-9]MBA6296947.1 oligosaccharide flippase family protein [Colwellia sp. MB02u-9]
MSLKKLLGFSLGPIVAALIGLISVPIITRLVLPEVFAQISLAHITVQLLLFGCLAGLDQAYIREFYETKSKVKLLTHTLGVNVLISVLLLILLYVFRDEVAYFLFDKSDALSVGLIGCILFQTMLLRYLKSGLRMKGMALSFSLVTILQSALNLIFILLLINFEILGNLHAILSANLISISSVTILAFLKLKLNFNNEPVKFDMLLFKSLLAFSLPLLVSSLFMWVLYSADQYMLRILSDFTELGLYSAAYKLCAALTLLQGIIAVYWIPLSLKWAKNNESIVSYERAGFIVSNVLLIIFLVVIVLKDWLILLLGENYSNALQIFPYLLMFPIYYALAEVASVGFSISRKNKFLVPITASCALVNIVLNYFAIPFWGAKGAAVVTAITFMLYFYLRLYFSNKVWKKVSYKSYNYLSIISVFTLIFSESNFSVYISLFILFVVSLNFLVKEKDTVLIICKKLRS